MTTQDTAPVPTGPVPTGPDPTGPAGTPPGTGDAAVPGHPRRRRGLIVTVALLVVAAAGGGSALYLRSTDGAGVTGPVRTAVAPPAAAVPTVAYVGLRPDGLAAFQTPLTLSVTDGTLTGVVGTGPEGTPVEGVVGPDGRWTSTTPLVPSATYALQAQVRDTAGRQRSLPLPVTTAPTDKPFGVTLVPGDGATVGVGEALSVRLATPVKDQATRAAVERALTVTTVPAVQGAWRWMSSTELRYRGPDMWAAGTKITMSAALEHVQAAPGVWGPATRTSTFTVGTALTSVVDVAAHTMTVSQDGQVVRVMKASMGKPGFDTRSGTFVVLEKFASLVMDSATVDLPPGTPAYKTSVNDAVRITNSGTFTHGAPWSVSSQGRANVSHGCINLSPVDAHWYYLQAKRGDVITVINSPARASLSDAGSQDWNMTFAQWKAGSALA